MGDIGAALRIRLPGALRQFMYDELSSIQHGKYPEDKKQAIIRHAYKIIAKNQLEILLFRHLDKEKTRRMITVTGKEKIDRAFFRGKGIILLIAHFGANKLVMPALGHDGYKINQVAGKPTEWIKIFGNELSYVSRKIFELELKNEKFLPANFIYVFKSMKPIFKCLKNNEIVCMAIDGGGGTKREKIDFLGRKAMISDGPFRIAQRTGAVILPAFVVRQTDDTHQLIIEEPIQVEPDLGKGNHCFNKLQEFMSLLEIYVDRYPSHYCLRLARARMLWRKDPIPFFTDYE